ncbi:uncharacterized protein LOC134222312 [Armigeres subalbatus]|uniref:uncharacterized protein LOC134222312 n=1 Tax=Armigeres subalbatus TaxID=124917 RepID=UPI002ED5B433
MTDPDVAAATSSVSVKLPEFWKTDPHMWFAQAKAQFSLAQVTKDDTKFWHIIAKIDQSVICHVADLVSTPPADNKYKAIKDRLIARFALSPQARLEQLLSSCDLGDFRPTHLLARMSEIATGLNVDDNLMKMLFLQRMPANIRTVLAISDGSLAKLAEMADKMIDSSNSCVSAVSVSTREQMAVNSVETTAKPSTEYASLREEIEVLTTEIRRLKNGQNRRRGRSASRPRAVNDSICWYHRKYGANAEHCREPCSYDRTKN